MDYITPEEMRAAEVRAGAIGLDEATLMENAGAAVAEVVEQRYSSTGRKLLVVCGLGNNGGDGMVVARRVGGRWRVRLLLLGEESSIKTKSARNNWSQLGARVETAEARDVPSLASREEWFDSADVVVDAVLGTGVRGEVREPLATAIRMINGTRGAKVAIDIPSGLDPASGKAAEATVRADLTVALHRAKIGLRGKTEYTGEVVVVPIGIVD